MRDRLRHYDALIKARIELQQLRRDFNTLLSIAFRSSLSAIDRYIVNEIAARWGIE